MELIRSIEHLVNLWIIKMLNNMITNHCVVIKEEHLMNIYNLVKENNESNGQKTALSLITTVVK